MDRSCLAINVHALKHAVHVGCQFVDHCLVLLALPSIKFALSSYTLNVNDKVLGIHLVKSDVPGDAPQGVHIASVPVCIDISKRLTRTEDTHLDAIDGLLVES